MSSASASPKSISLVLGSGGARGLVHIGVIKWLEEHNHNIVSVSGSSAGALIGGIYALGKLDEFEHWVRAISATDIVKLLDISFDRDGLIRGERIIETLKDLIGDCLIEELSIPFTAVASDVAREREVWLNKGPLFEAVRASISLPLFFKPTKINGDQLLDGGILNPVPIAPTFNDDSDVTIAVNLGGKPDPNFKVPAAPQQEEQEEAGFIEKVSEFVAKFDLGKAAAPRKGSMLEIADRTFDAMQGTIARQKLAAYPPDIELLVPSNVCGTLEFDRAAQMIQLGYELAERKLAKL